MGDGNKTAMKDRDEGLGLAALLLLSGILARLQATGINSLNDTRLLLDRAILTLENMPFQDEAVRKARVGSRKPLRYPRRRQRQALREVHEARMVPGPFGKMVSERPVTNKVCCWRIKN
jgi:hypothetical protein